MLGSFSSPKSQNTHKNNERMEERQRNKVLYCESF